MSGSQLYVFICSHTETTTATQQGRRDNARPLFTSFFGRFASTTTHTPTVRAATSTALQHLPLAHVVCLPRITTNPLPSRNSVLEFVPIRWYHATCYGAGSKNGPNKSVNVTMNHQNRVKNHAKFARSRLPASLFDHLSYVSLTERRDCK